MKLPIHDNMPEGTWIVNMNTTPPITAMCNIAKDGKRTFSALYRDSIITANTALEFMWQLCKIQTDQLDIAEKNLEDFGYTGGKLTGGEPTWCGFTRDEIFAMASDQDAKDWEISRLSGLVDSLEDRVHKQEKEIENLIDGSPDPYYKE